VARLTQTESNNSIVPPVLAKQDDEELDETFVQLFIGRANQMRHSYGLPDLWIGALAPSGPATTVRVEDSHPPRRWIGFLDHVLQWLEGRMTHLPASHSNSLDTNGASQELF
jgi:hypothetical protein